MTYPINKTPQESWEWFRDEVLTPFLASSLHEDYSIVYHSEEDPDPGLMTTFDEAWDDAIGTLDRFFNDRKVDPDRMQR